MTSFRWKGGWPGRLESIIVFNSLAFEYDNLRQSTTFASDLVTQNSDIKVVFTFGIAGRLITAENVAPHDFA